MYKTYIQLILVGKKKLFMEYTKNDKPYFNNKLYYSNKLVE